MPYSDYPHGFAQGITLRNIPVDVVLNPLAHTFWVDSVHGSNEYKGTFKRPFQTLAYAITQCTDSHGDVIYVAAGHTETVVAAGTVTINKIGVTVVFLGEGSTRAKINYTTLVSASIIISAANATLINPVFVSGIDALTSPITISGADCKILNAKWYDAAGKAATNAIVATNAAARLVIDGYKYYVSTTGTQKVSHIKFADNATPRLSNIDIVGDFSTAPIYITAAATNLVLDTVKLNNLNVAPKPCIDLHANTTGMAKNVDARVASGTTYVSSVAKLNWDNSSLGYNTDGYAGDPIGTGASIGIEGKVDAIKAVTDLLPNAGALTTISTAVSKVDGLSLAVAPVAGSLARFVASGGTALGAQLADSKSIVNALGSDGTTLLYGSGSTLGAIGTEFWIKKQMVSSAILEATPVDITGVSSGGELAILDVIVKTDGTGLATGTNFEIKSDNAMGLLNIFVETVANLGATKTVDLAGASVTKIKTVLSVGKKLQVHSTVAACTGGGLIDIYVKFQRLAAGATIAAL